MAMPRGAFLLIAAALAAGWYLFHRAAAPGDHAGTDTRAQLASARAAPGWFSEDEGGCLLPRRIDHTGQDLERAALNEWRAGGSGDTLRIDPCGNVWALWFNSWVIHVADDPSQRGTVSLPRGNEAVAAIVNSGIADFLPRRGELWLSGRHGSLVRYRHGSWRRIEAPGKCFSGQLVEFGGEVVFACHGVGTNSLHVWDAAGESGSWRSLSGELRTFGRVATSQEGALITAGGGSLLVLRDPAGGPWQTVPHAAGSPVEMAADAARIAIADESGLEIVDYAGRPLIPRFEIEGIRGVALDARGVWVAVWRAGLHFHDGRAWHRWDYAKGLPDDTARDLLLSPGGRLWLAGTPSAAIDSVAAAEAIPRLQAPNPIAARIYADACAAADSELTNRAASEEVSRESGIERKLVFFRASQVCPDPHAADYPGPVFTRRRADGALLRMTHNPQRDAGRCPGDCSGAAYEALAERWRLALFVPQSLSARSGFDRIDLVAPDPLPREPPMPEPALPDDGTVWLATRSEGVLRFDDGAWQRFGAADGFSPANPVVDLAHDHLGRVWVYTHPSTSAVEASVLWPLHRWQGGTWTHQGLGQVSDSIQGRSLIPTSNAMLIATNGPLLRIDGAGVPVSTGDDGVGDASDVSVDRAGYFWIAESLWSSRRGIRILDRGRTGRLDARDGLFEDRIRAIAHDGDGGIWMLAEQGRVAVYDRQVLFRAARWTGAAAFNPAADLEVER